MIDDHSAQHLSPRIRATRQELEVIDQAADLLGNSRSDFVVDAAYREALRILFDQAIFTLDDESFARFEALLDTLPAPTDQLRKLLSSPAPWDQWHCTAR